MTFEVMILTKLSEVSSEGVPKVLAVGQLGQKMHGFLMPLYETDLL